ncbi:exodeoxyribonuclease VII large subunit [Castellaniella sp.]|uniref:exodeoxyribonuclease VII large subunit n=1 Tax=Castellaniella sp. TaxID=1955812 RepID=UPI003C75B231
MNFPDEAPASSGFPADEPVLSVAQLNRQVARLLEAGIPRLWVAGEISNFTRAASGHWYFSIKDESAAVRAVMFRGRAQAVGFVPEVGGRYEFRVQVSLYEPRGDYQVQVESLRRAGRGDLHEAFLRLKDQLSREGLIDAGRRRAIPTMPRTVGVVTSLAAAALRDVLSVMARRAPHVRVILYPAPVQGREAAAQLCQALDQAAARNEIDVLLLVRGGGSLEDLWSFNDEALARRIAASPVPVVSGVGHETDFTIADFVADLRAPTPTAAAELCCLSRDQLLGQVRAAADDLARAQRRRLEYAGMRVDRAAAQLVSPAQRLHLHRQRLETAMQRLTLPLPGRMRQQAQDARRAGERLHACMDRLLQRGGHRLAVAESALQALDPRAVLTRGYAIVRGPAGSVVKNALDLKIDARLDIEFAQGRAQATVTRTDTLL